MNLAVLDRFVVDCCIAAAIDHLPLLISLCCCFLLTYSLELPNHPPQINSKWCVTEESSNVNEGTMLNSNSWQVTAIDSVRVDSHVIRSLSLSPLFRFASSYCKTAKARPACPNGTFLLPHPTLVEPPRRAKPKRPASNPKCIAWSRPGTKSTPISLSTIPTNSFTGGTRACFLRLPWI